MEEKEQDKTIVEEVEAELVDEGFEPEQADEIAQHMKKKGFLFRIHAILNSSGFFLALVSFILVGCFVKGGTAGDAPIGWAVGWIAFLLPPIISSIIEAIWRRRFCVVLVPLLVVCCYVGCGIVGNFYGLNFWHPWWALFFIIPVYYSIFGEVDHLLHRKDK